ncbi:MAG: flavin reductase family protein [Firmicutes bacterium]|nr:flavin reductase family protein [Bacillota bacterium]
MKKEITRTKPENLAEMWPGQLDIFSHIDYAAGVPQAIFLITTLKPDGKVNACLHGWTAFNGGKNQYYAVMTGISRDGHTYQNLMRDKEFCINFLSPAYYDACKKTIEENKDDVDELAAAGLTAEPAACVKAPRVAEAFLAYECRLVSDVDFANEGGMRLIVGEVVRAALDPLHETWRNAGGADGFMYYMQAEGESGGIGRLEGVRDA